jgi:hypothetical protein
VKNYCTECWCVFCLEMQGLEKTAKSNFGGGNTNWEEKKLGSFANRWYDWILHHRTNSFTAVLLKFKKWSKFRSRCIYEFHALMIATPLSFSMLCQFTFSANNLDCYGQLVKNNNYLLFVYIYVTLIHSNRKLL